MGDAVTQAGGTWIDLLPAFRAGYKSGLYFPKDVHWTPEGHRLAAETLSPLLRLRLSALLPE
jgi:hypothetical protein